ncbi:MAG TPA: hypothetical protein VM490_23605 [Armatimonadaceae bacterium]|nr:hypothetical protein [Armatimonadaceae bacterium]
MQSDHAGNVAGSALPSDVTPPAEARDRARVPGPEADRARERFARLYGGGPGADSRPGADGEADHHALLLALERSDAFRALRPRIADALPLDGWLAEGLRHFVFRLRPSPADSKDPAADAASDAYALFLIHPDADAPTLTLIVHAGSDGLSATVTDVRTPDIPYHIAVHDEDE